MHEIDQQIAELDIDALAKKVRLVSFTGEEVKPRDYQWLTFDLTAKELGKYQGPFIVNASVGAGKTIMMAMVANRFSRINAGGEGQTRGLLMARQAELINQNSEALWTCGVKNSVFSAGLKSKAVAYPVLCGTEKSLYNALYKELIDFVPSYLIIDEAHMLSWEDYLLDESETVYAKIIKEMQKRCLEKYGKQLRIIGYTGSPFRHTQPIIGKFWRKQVCNISSDYLVKRGFLVPTIFGDISSDTMYDLSAYSSTGEDGLAEFTAEQMRQMERDILSQGTKTQKIMLDVMRRTANRNGVLITCSGKKHCEEAARYLPAGSYVIVTESMGMKARTKALDDAKNARVKYVLQIGCLTTGVDCSYWDTSVILRKIGSLTLLIQLLGRGMRLLKDFLHDAGIRKDDHLVLDYTDTMAELGGLYSDPILEAADLQKAKKDHSTIQCPQCHTENSPRARRCIGDDPASDDGRCEYFFSSKTCEDREIGGIGKIIGCGALNDPCARVCRKCGEQIYDPNKNLNERFYTDDDYVTVKRFIVEPTRNAEGVIYRYWYDDADGVEKQAREVFMVSKSEGFIRNMWKAKGVFPHVKDPSAKSRLIHAKSSATVMQYAPLITAPIKITHRVNDKGGDIINRKVFPWDE